MVVIVFQTDSIAAGAEVSVMATTAAIRAASSSVLDRVITRIGIAGATVNTGELTAYIGTDAVGSIRNGVTNTAGAPIKQEDAYPKGDDILANEQLDLRVRNLSAGALQYYVYLEIEDVYD